MTPALVLGFLAGVRHTLEPDHLAAVASLGRERGLGHAVRRGAAWGLGHSTTLLVFGGGSLVLGQAIPEGWAKVFDAFVGVLLVALGADVLRRLVARKAQAHVHADGTSHAEGPSHRRALCVGALHGLAGSGALVVLVLGSTPDVFTGLVWIALFGLGSVGGMALMSAVMTAPLTVAGPRLAPVALLLEVLVGASTVAVGAQLLAAQLA